MTLQQFETLLSNYKTFNENLHELYYLGFDFYEGKFKLSEIVEKLLTTSIESIYGKDGMEWVDWFVVETNYGRDENITAKDAEGNQICYDIESLYNYLQKNYKN
jgi:hypothetical protein